MPSAFQNITVWDDERNRKWAASVGEHTAKTIVSSLSQLT